MLILPSEIMFASKQPKHHDKAFVLQKALHDDAGRINSSLSILFNRPDFIPLLPLKCTSLFKCTFNQLQISQNVLPSVISVQGRSAAAVRNQSLNDQFILRCPIAQYQTYSIHSRKFTMRVAKLSYESLFYFSLQKRQKKAVMRIIVGLCKIIKIIGSIMVGGGN